MENTPKRKTTQAKSPVAKRNSPELRETTIRPPRLVPGGIYSTEDILVNLGICRGTLLKWKRNRIHKLHPLDLGTKEEFFSGTAVVAFLETFRHSVNG